MLCAPAKLAGNAQDIAHLPSTPGCCGLSPCSTSERSHLLTSAGAARDHLSLLPLALALPGTVQGPTIALEAFRCSCLSLLTAHCSHHRLGVLRPEITAASSAVPRKAGKGQWLWSRQPRNTRSSCLCQQTCFSLISLSGYDTLPSLGFFCLLKHRAE